MKWVYGMVFSMYVFVSLLFSSCSKEAVVPALARQKPHSTVVQPLIKKPLRPDTAQPTRYLKPLLPYLPFVRTRCIGSYAELVGILGANRVSAKAVVLENGMVIPVGAGILSMDYWAEPKIENYSLFRSALTVNYNYYGYVQSHSSEVWSVGCVYEQAGVPPYTNLKRFGQVITINTKLYWGIGEQAGQLIQYLVLE